MKKFLALCFVLAVGLALLTGCDRGGSGGQVAAGELVMSAPGVFPIVEQPINMTIVMPDVPYIGELNTNAFAEWYQEMTNVNMYFQTVPHDNVIPSVNLLLAANDLPDIFMHTVVDAAVNGPRGVFIALNELIDRYGVETRRIFDENSSDLPGMITAVDGNIYALPNINDCFHCRRTFRAWINMEWLDEFGLDYPNTLEEFEHVLRTFRDAGRIPMSGAGVGGAQLLVYPFLLNSFMYYQHGQGNYMYVDNGTIMFAPLQPEFREGLRWIRGLFEEGLIEPMALTQTGEQLLQLGADPAGPQVGVATAFVWWQAVPGDDVSPDLRSRNFEALSPLEGPGGWRNSPLTHRAPMRDFAVITSASERPDIAFRWLDALYLDEVTKRSQLGLPDEQWFEPPAGALGINRLPALYHATWFESDAEAIGANVRMDNIMMANRSSRFRLGEMADWDDPETMWAQEPRLFRITNDFYEPFTNDHMAVPPLNFTEEEGQRNSMLNPQIHDHVLEFVPLFLSGTRCLDDDWDEFVSIFESIGWEEYVAIRQAAFDRQFGG